MSAECRISSVESGGPGLVQSEITYQCLNSSAHCGRCALNGTTVAEILQERLNNGGNAHTAAIDPFCAASVDRVALAAPDPLPDAMTVTFARQ